MSGVYSVVNACHTETLNLTITTCNNGVVLHLTMFLQGYYTGNLTMTPSLLNQGVTTAVGTEADSVTIELRDSLDPTVVVGSVNTLLNTDGSATATFSAAQPGTSYWIVVKQRNSIQTWSGMEVMMSATTSYDFSVSATQSFGSNVVEVESGVWAVYSGDVNQDEYVDNYDFPYYDTDNLNFATGYFATDFNGDGFVDNYDFPIYDVNNLNFVSSIHP
jgi:hypothetical protein